MDINENISVYFPTDGQNIIRIKPYRKTIDGKEIIVKAYQIVRHIWLIPNRFHAEKIFNVQEDEKSNFGIYDENFLLDDCEQELFLQGMIRVFKRLNSTIDGKKLLSLLVAALPFPEKTKNQYLMNNTIYCEDYKKNFVANIIIYGSGTNIMENKVFAKNSDFASNGKGSPTEVCFQPFVVSRYGLYLQDPVLELTKCLIKSLYSLYGFGLNNVFLPNKIDNHLDSDKFSVINLEEALISGGNDYRVLTKKPYWLLTDIFQTLKSNFELFKSSFDSIKGDPNLEPSIKEYLAQKYSLEIRDLWHLTVSKFASSFNVTTPLSYSNSIHSFSYPNYYLIDYDKNIYNENGYINGQTENSLKSYKYYIEKPSQIIEYSVDDIKFKANIFNNGLKKDTSFYSKYKLAYSDDFLLLNDNDPNNLLILPSVNNNLIDNILPIKTVVSSSDEISPLPDMNSPDMAEEKSVSIPLPIHYVLAGKYRGNVGQTFKFSDDFHEVISQKDNSLVYSFLTNTINFFKDYDKRNIKTGEEYSRWLKDILENYTIDITKTKAINNIEGISQVIPWLGKALNLLNTSNPFEDEISINGIGELITKHPRIVIPKSEIDAIPPDNSPISQHQMDQKLFLIYLKNKSYFLKNYYFLIHQWWTLYNSQFLYLCYLSREAILNQQNSLFYLIEKQLDNLDPTTRQNGQLNAATEGMQQTLMEKSQIAIKNATDFLTNCSISYFFTDLYPKFIGEMEKVAKKMNNIIKQYILKNNSEIGEAGTTELIDKYTMSKKNFDLYNGKNFQEIVKSDNQLGISTAKKTFDLLLQTEMNSKNKEIKDISGNNAIVDYSETIQLVEGRNEIAIQLQSPEQFIKMTSTNFQFGLTKDFTIDFWLRTPNLVENHSTLLTYEGNPDGVGWKLGLENNGLVWRMTDLHRNEINSYFPNCLNESWHHLIVSVNRIQNKVKIFIDGQQIVNENIQNILNMGLKNQITLQSDGAKVLIDSFSILSYPLEKQEVIARYKKYSEDSFLRDSFGYRLKYNKEYELYNKVYPEENLQQVQKDLITYIAIQNDQSESNSLKIRLLNNNKTKTFVEHDDTVLISIPGQSGRYFTNSDGKNEIEVGNQPVSFTVQGAKSDSTIVSFHMDQHQALRLSNREGVYNWLIRDSEMFFYERLLNIFYWYLRPTQSNDTI